MKISRDEFFKLLGGGAAIAGAVTLPAKLLEVQPAIKDAHATIGKEISSGGRRPICYDVRSGILFSRFDPSDFKQRDRVPLFTRTVMDYPTGTAATNIYLPGSLPAPEMFAVSSVSIIADRTATPRQLEQFEYNVTGNLYIGSKSYIAPPMSRVLVSADFDKLVDRKGKPTNFISSKSFRVDPALVLDYGWSFYYELRIAQGIFGSRNDYKPDFGGYIILDGSHARGVQ